MKFRKGGSHIGIILSFVIFIGFFLFLFSILDPEIRETDGKAIIMKSIRTNLENEIRSNLTTFTVSNESASSYGCLKINMNEIETSGLNAAVKDFLGEEVFSEISGNYLLVDLSGGEKVYQIYVSEEEFLPTSGTCNSPNLTFYEVDYLKTRQEIFESNVIEMMSLYDSNYEDIKNKLAVPIGMDFSFGFVYENGTEIESSTREVTGDIFASEKTINYVSQDGNIKSGVLKIKIWK